MSILRFLQPAAPGDEGEEERELKRARQAAAPGSFVEAVYAMPVGLLEDGTYAAHVRRLTMCPVESFGAATPFNAYLRDGGYLRVPRYYGLREWGPAASDRTTDGAPVALRFEGRLSAVQLDATAAYEAHLAGFAEGGPRGGIVVLPCGYGKTVFALQMAARLGRRTLVLVHKGFLLQQWQERARQFLPGATLGLVQQATAQVEADVVIGMVQSIARRNYPEGTFDGFGFVVIDEAHHMAAPIFSLAMRRLAARTTLALSATPERRDRLDDLLRWSMGDICFRVARQPEMVHIHSHAYEQHPAPRPLLTRDGRPNIAQMVNRLACDPRRNRLLVRRIARYAAEGRRLIVMSDRLEQLLELDRLLCELCAAAPAAAVPTRGHYVGRSSAVERTAAAGCDVVFTTFSMSREALDIAELDTLVMATPVGNVEQVVGRILRKHPDKQTPVVFDVLDTYQPFEGMRRKRHKLYRREGYQVTDVPA